MPPAVTFQPHELIVALLAQLQLPAVLAQELLVVAVDLLDGLADLVWGCTVLLRAGSTHLPYHAARHLPLLLSSCLLPPALG